MDTCRKQSSLDCLTCLFPSLHFAQNWFRWPTYKNVLLYYFFTNVWGNAVEHAEWLSQNVQLYVVHYKLSFLIRSECVTAVFEMLIAGGPDVEVHHHKERLSLWANAACSDYMLEMWTCPFSEMFFSDPPSLPVTDHHTSDLDIVNCLLTLPAARFTLVACCVTCCQTDSLIVLIPCNKHSKPSLKIILRIWQMFAWGFIQRQWCNIIVIYIFYTG